MILKQLPTYISELIKYQSWLAMKNNVQLTSWQALRNGMASTGKVMLKSLLKPTNLVTAGVGTMIAVIYKTNQAIKEVRERADELSNSFNNNKSDIEGYKDKIKDLYKTINDSGSSLEEVTTARQTLMTVQEDLIDKFGDEKETIDLVTQAIYGQSSALDELIQKKWQETKNEFNESDMWNDYANWQEGYSDNIDRMVHEMENAWGNIKMSTSDYFGGEYDDIIKRLEEAGWKYSSSSETFVKGGSVEDLYEEILDIQTLVGDDMPDNFLKSLTNDANELKATLDNYEGMWDNYILNDRIFADKNLADSWKEINDAYSEYKDAFATGDEESIKKAQDNFANILTQATEGVSDESVVDFFNDMYPSLQEVVGNWQFETNFTANTDGLKDDVSGLLSGLDGLYSYDLKNFSYDTATEEQKASYDGLISVARLYGLTIDQLIDKLALMGLVQDENYQKLVDLFGQDAVDKLTPEDLEIAYTISSKEADKALEQEKNKIKSELESLSKEGNVDLTIRPVIDSSAMQAAGWDVEDGSIATTFTQGEFIWQGDEENGQYVYIHYTPILPDGTVLTPDELTDYLYGTLEGSQSVLDADNKGIVLKVDTDLNIPEGDIKKFTNGEGSTDAIDGLIQKTGEWDDKVHDVQEQYYDTGEGIGYASNALDGLIEKHKQLKNGNKITVSNIFGLEDADGKLTTLGTLNEQVDNLQKAYTGLKSAMDSYNKSGYFTLDQVQEIVSYGDGYLQYLMDEKGNLQLNEEALNKLMVARINEMRVKALSDLYNQVSSIQDETDALAFLEGRLTDVTEATNEYNEAKFQSLLLSKRELMSDEAYSKFESSVIKMVNTTNALFDNIDVGSFSGKGLDDLAKAAKETLESTLAVHKAELDAGIIDLDTYLKKCNGLLNDARDKAIITSAEYWDYQKEVLENQKKVYDKALSAINRRYDKEIDSIEKVINALEKQNEALEKQLAKYDSAISAITKFLDTQKDLLQDNIDGIEAENDVIQDEIDGYDQLLNAVTLVIDAKREAVEADKQAIQDRIDALREENDEAKRAYELEQARFELERLRNSRTKKLYVQSQGYIFDVDHSAIREQEDSVADLELDATTSALEKEQELLDNILEQLDATEQKWQDIADIFENNKALEKAKELLGDNFKDIILEGDNKSINDILNVYIGAQGKLENNTLIIEDYEKRMKQLDAIAKKWENVANIKEETENAINAAELLGKEWQEIVLADRAENYEEFCAKYLEIQSKIDDNTSMIESYEEKVEYYENLKQQWSDIADAYKYAEEDMYLTQVLGSNAEADLLNGRLDTLENFKVQYMATQQAIIDAAWNSANEQNKALASIGSGSTDGKGDISGGLSLSEPTQEEIIIIKKTPRSPYKKNMVAQVFHDGIKKGYPNASVPKDKKLETLQKLATEEIPLKNDELPIIARNDELLINEPQQLMLVENYQKLMESMSAIPWNVPIMNTNPLANVGMIKREQPISISIGDIHLHEVQNVPDFAAELNKYLPNISVQYNGRHK